MSRYNNKRSIYILITCFFLVIVLAVGLYSIFLKEDINDGYDNLYNDDVKSFGIDTSYGKLLFPQKWESYMYINKIEENDFEKIEFWASTETQNDVHIFDICFGGDGYKVGIIQVDDDTSLSVNVISYDIEVSDECTDEEEAILFSISEDINYVLINLNLLDGFTASGPVQ